MKKHLLKTILLLFALVAGTGSLWAQTVTLWTEDWSGTTSSKTPSECTITGYSDITYSYGDGGGTTQTYDRSSFTDPELLIAKSNGTFTVTIPASRLTDLNSTLSLKFDCNRDLTLTVTNGTLGSKSTSSSTYTYPITVKDNTKALVIEFKNTGSKNSRFSNASLTGTAVAPAYTITAVSNNEAWGTVSGTSTITATPKEGYRVAAGDGGYTVTSGTATVTNNGDNTFSVTPSTNCTVRINFEEIPSYTLSSAVSPAAAGTVTLGSTSVKEGSTTTATAAANAGYKFTGWSISGTDASLSSTTDNPTEVTMGTADATVTANFAAVVTHQISWSVNGVIVKTENVEEDAAIDFSAPTSALPNGYAFQGWVTEADKIDTPTDTDPSATYVTSATSTADVTYYAVMAIVKSSTPASWTEASLASLTASDVFVFSNGTYAMNNDGGTSNQPTVNSITVSDGKITSEVADNLKWQVSGNDEDGYTFYPNGSTTTWMYCNTTASSSSNNNIRVGTGDRKVWIFDTNGYLVTNDTYTDRYLSIYNDQDFRGYTSNSSAFVPKFYKYVPSSSVCEGYCTSAKVSVAVTNVNYATFVSEFDLDFTGSPIEAYIAKADGTTGVTFTRVNKVPANTGVLLHAANAMTRSVPVLSGAADDVTGNVFKQGAGAAVASEEGSLHNYILNNVGGVVGFYKASGQTVGTNRAYIQIDESTPVKGFIALPGSDEETGINAIDNGQLTMDNAIYDLSGRRVAKPTRGLYIVNGKKVLVK